MSIWPYGVKKLSIWWHEDNNAFIAWIRVHPKMALKDDDSLITMSGTRVMTCLVETDRTISLNELVCDALKPTNTLPRLWRLLGS